jgi:hypothetical protein
MLNHVIITALLSAAGVMLGAGLQYYFSRSLESRKQLALQRSQSFVDYFKAIALIAQHGPSREHSAMLADAKVRVCIYGSAEVVKLLRDFEAVGSVLNSIQSTTLITELLAEMRKDAGMGVTGVDREELRRILFGSKSLDHK